MRRSSEACDERERRCAARERRACDAARPARALPPRAAAQARARKRLPDDDLIRDARRARARRAASPSDDALRATQLRPRTHARRARASRESAPSSRHAASPTPRPRRALRDAGRSTGATLGARRARQAQFGAARAAADFTRDARRQARFLRVSRLRRPSRFAPRSSRRRFDGRLSVPAPSLSLAGIRVRLALESRLTRPETRSMKPDDEQ